MSRAPTNSLCCPGPVWRVRHGWNGRTAIWQGLVADRSESRVCGFGKGQTEPAFQNRRQVNRQVRKNNSNETSTGFVFGDLFIVSEKPSDPQTIREITKHWLDAIPMEWLEAGHAQVCQDKAALAEIRVLAAQGYRRARLFLANYCEVS